jgi:hypothetical protein
MTTDAQTREQVREQVRALLTQGWSDRAIGQLPGMPSRHTVRRWRTSWDAEQNSAHTPEPPGAQPDAPPGADRLVLNLDGNLGEDLAILTDAGLDPQTAVALAVQLLADAHRAAWDYGDAPRGTLIEIRTHAAGAPGPDCAPRRTPPGTGLYA